jgi:hypothetical protein
MKRALWLVLLMLLVAPLSGMAQSSFDGTWKVDVNKAQFPQKPDVYVLQDGMYHCKTCVPPIDVKADGQDQKVTGHPYYDTISIKVVDDRTVEETEKKGGKVVATSKTTVSPEGTTATVEFSDETASNGGPVTGRAEIMRVAKGPAGSQAISGSWRTKKVEDISDNGLMFTYKVEGDTLSMSSPTGQSYTAKLDGTDAPFKGDPGTTSVSVKRLSKDTLEETDKRDGKVISVARITVAPDGKTMSVAVTDKLHGTSSHFVAEKQ